MKFKFIGSVTKFLGDSVKEMLKLEYLNSRIYHFLQIVVKRCYLNILSFLPPLTKHLIKILRMSTYNLNSYFWS